MALDRFAVISDIHGNVDALAAVLADIQSLGLECILNLGDHFSGPLAPAETAELLLPLKAISIAGNHDRILVQDDPATMGLSDRIAHDQLPPEAMDWLGDLPPTRRIEDVFLCHGTPQDDTTYWLEQPTPDGHVAMAERAYIRAQMAGVDASLMLCGHTHIPRRIDLPGGQVIVNPGSVGCPAYRDTNPIPHTVENGTPAASYAVITREDGGWRSDFRRVNYDSRRMARLACQAGAGEWARAVGTGWLSD